MFTFYMILTLGTFLIVNSKGAVIRNGNIRPIYNQRTLEHHDEEYFPGEKVINIKDESLLPVANVDHGGNRIQLVYNDLQHTKEWSLQNKDDEVEDLHMTGILFAEPIQLEITDEESTDQSILGISSGEDVVEDKPQETNEIDAEGEEKSPQEDATETDLDRKPKRGWHLRIGSVRKRKQKPKRRPSRLYGR